MSWRRAFVDALPLVAIYVILIWTKDAPLVVHEPNALITLVSDIISGLFLASGVAVVETRAWTQRARVAGYVIAAAAATVGMLGVFDGILEILDVHTKVWPWWVKFWGNSGPTLVHSLFAIALYRMWRNARARAAALREMQGRRVALLRETAQADLLAMQARIDPTFLLETLRAIDGAYAAGLAGGRRLIDALIDYLRAALPGTDVATSTLGKECDLARAYLDLTRERYGLDLDVSVAAATARGAQFPPMLVLPIVDDIVKYLRALHDPGRVLLRAAAPEGNATLAIAVEPQYRPSADTLALVQERLAKLSAGRVTVHESTVTLEAPHALASRPDR